jgi:Predicted transcriptional regulators
MKIFAERLRELRKLHKINQSKLAEVLSINQRQISYYENDTNEPSLESLIALADYFSVSVDYLLGRTDDPKVHGRTLEITGRTQRIYKK